MKRPRSKYFFIFNLSQLLELKELVSDILYSTLSALVTHTVWLIDDTCGDRNGILLVGKSHLITVYPRACKTPP